MAILIRPGPKPSRPMRFATRIGLMLLALLSTAAAGRTYTETSRIEPRPGHILVAGRNVVDPSFAESVVMLVQHNDENGSLGFIINRPIPHKLSDALPELELDEAANAVVFFGGPVGVDTLMYLYRAEQPYPSSLPVAGDMNLSADRNLLSELLAAQPSNADLRVFLGHAGWLPQQLETELAHGDWHLIPNADDAVLQADPIGIWQRLIERIEPEGLISAGLDPGEPAVGDDTQIFQ